MKKMFLLFLASLIILASPLQSVAQRGSRSSHGSVKSNKSSTYEVGGTKYKANETYKSTGLPKVERSSSAKHEFLKNQGYKKTPQGYEVDHVVPLSKGGPDKPYNMQLLPKETHRQKTANERKRK